MNYYNEFDPKAAAWLRELIRHGHLPPGDVDQRSVEDVAPADLLGYNQCHFFAGIGGWSLALRPAGWPDDRPVWTGSCPCQPFSQAGAGKGVDDPRHLWPAFRWLIDQCRPAIVFGEQVASKAGRGWLSGVRIDLEAMGYGVGAADLCAAGVGAPHIRQRLFWVADTPQRGLGMRGGASGECGLDDQRGEGSGVGHSLKSGLERHAGDVDGAPGRQEQTGSTAEAGSDGGLADTDTAGQCEHSERDGIKAARQQASRRDDAGGCGEDDRPGSHHSGWTDVDWLFCRDGVWRPVEPGTFPLANGIPARVVRLRGYGNAIVPQLAAEFINAFLGAVR